MYLLFSRNNLFVRNLFLFKKNLDFVFTVSFTLFLRKVFKYFPLICVEYIILTPVYNKEGFAQNSENKMLFYFFDMHLEGDECFD